MNKYYYGLAFVLLSAFCSASMPSFVKMAYANDVSVMTVLFFRFSLTAAVLFSILFITKQNIRLDKKSLLGLFLIGSILGTAQSAAFFSALNYIPASLAILIAYVYPAFTAIVTSLWDHEPITKQIALSLLVCFAGLILMLGTAVGEIKVFGIILALASAFFYTGYVVLCNRIMKKMSPLITGSFISLFAMLGTIFLSLFYDSGINFAFQSTAWPSIFSLALFSVFTILALFKGLKLLGPTKTSILSTSEPLFGVVIAMILFQERLTLVQWLGAAGVIAGAVLAVYEPNTDLKAVTGAKTELVVSDPIQADLKPGQGQSKL